MLGLIVTHAMVTVVAAAFGYLAVITLRETLVAILGPRWFSRVSPWAQGVLIVMLGGSLLLLPPAANRIAQRGFEGWRAMSPPMWFLGAYEMTAGGVIADLPRTRMTPRQANNDHLASSTYRERRGHFPAMAGRAGLAIGLTFLSCSRRLHLECAAPAVARANSVAGLPAALAAGRPARERARPPQCRVRAGFYFTLAAMWRSNTHRLTLACAAAAGLAMAVVVLSSSNVQLGGGASSRLLRCSRSSMAPCSSASAM